MELFVPDAYQQNIYTISYDKLKERGIHCILFDLDNTLVPADQDKPTKETQQLFQELKKKGFQLILFSNSGPRRLGPFKELLEVDCCASAMKPLKRNYLKVLKKYGLQKHEVAIVGDQLMTDVLGGNSVGITTILVNPISHKDIIFTKLNRRMERHIYKRLEKRGLLKRGRFYE